MKKIETQSLTHQAYQVLKNGLQEGEFTPMEPLVIRTLASAYGISATPIREALQRLVAERLLTVLPNRSIVVPRMTKGRFLEVMPIRIALEGMATQLATPNFSSAELAELDALLHLMAETTKTFDSKRYLLLNREFHFAIYQKAGNPELLQIISDLWVKVGPVFTSLFDDDYYRNHANDEHQNILDAFRRGDAEATESYMKHDISLAAKALLPRLPDDETH